MSDLDHERSMRRAIDTTTNGCLNAIENDWHFQMD